MVFFDLGARFFIIEWCEVIGWQLINVRCPCQKTWLLKKCFLCRLLVTLQSDRGFTPFPYPVKECGYMSYNTTKVPFLHQKRRKRKSTDTSLLEQSCEIGLGTTVGSIFIFDVLTGEIKTHLVSSHLRKHCLSWKFNKCGSSILVYILQKDGHDDKVNDVKWNKTTDLLYSCSDDKYITEWEVETQEIKWFVLEKTWRYLHLEITRLNGTNL